MIDKGTETPNEKSTPKYKDSLIKRLVQDDEVAREIANALLGKNYPKGSNVHALDIENNLTRYYGDAVINAEGEILVVIEQQSTINNNMPLRILPQITDILYAFFINRKELYKYKLYKIPSVKFFVLYNRIRDWNPGKLKLSDAFKIPSEEITLELIVNVININYENRDTILEKSSTLKGYSYLVNLIRRYQEEGFTRDEAIKEAISRCIDEGVLKEYLEKYFWEVADMLVFEYDEKVLHGEAMYEEGLEKGLEQGVEKIISLIKQGHTIEEAAILAKKKTE